MTFSLVARCDESGMFGVVISSSSPAVAARCSHARAGVGAVASQNVTDPHLGVLALDRMAQGETATRAIEDIRAQNQFMEYRQLLAVDKNGESAIHSGEKALGVWSQAHARNVAAGGNLLASESVPQALIDGFLSARGSFGDRLMTALRSGLAAGGEAGAVHSAGMKIVDRLTWPCVDLRCDWSNACPIEELERTWEVYKPQVDAYVQRALDPREAPSYGVPGDE
ncbi:MAG: DUF1028 domain-containing protein [Hyphomicrobiales bacterium]|nr:DUF1028 domain-containing protein [Hyphomicrobiales bacterium]MCY4032688.1 DUF1028 domain-containing protein [Hyphomicrobiales bacterium]MCY4038486.1 DUF1028 domain-containing protein [Hyphomicrobiales bacterium]